MMSSPLPSVLRGGLPRAPRQSTEMALGSLHRIIRALAGDEWRPLEAHLTHPPPRNRKYYRSFFGCPIVFNSEIDALLISARDLERPIPSGAPADRATICRSASRRSACGRGNGMNG